MNKGLQYTRVFMLIGVMVIAIYDLAALTLWGVEATISRVVGVEGSFDSPFIPFAVGIVMGHLFWHQKRTKRAGDED